MLCYNKLFLSNALFMLAFLHLLCYFSAMKKKEDKFLSPHAQRVLDLLKKEGKPLTAYAIMDKLHRFGFRAPPTVYRALDALVAHGLVHKLESINAFMVCHHEEHHADHISPFAICTSCGKAEEIEDDALFRRMKKLGSTFLSHINSKALEITGLCHDCSRKD